MGAVTDTACSSQLEDSWYYLLGITETAGYCRHSVQFEPMYCFFGIGVVCGSLAMSWFPQKAQLSLISKANGLLSQFTSLHVSVFYAKFS